MSDTTPRPFPDGEGLGVTLLLDKVTPADPDTGRVPAEHYSIVEKRSGAAVGTIRLRLSEADDIRLYAGHIGYRVDDAHRGQGYAAQACITLRTRAVEYGFRALWITCDPDNWPSRRTCERIGAALIEIIDLPDDNDMYQDGERQKCRYRWQLV